MFLFPNEFCYLNVDSIALDGIFFYLNFSSHWILYVWMCVCVYVLGQRCDKNREGGTGVEKYYRAISVGFHLSIMYWFIYHSWMHVKTIFIIFFCIIQYLKLIRMNFVLLFISWCFFLHKIYLLVCDLLVVKIKIIEKFWARRKIWQKIQF